MSNVEAIVDARAEKMRSRKELRERLDVAELEDLAAAEPELLDQALARLNLFRGPTWTPRSLRGGRSSSLR